MGLSNEEPTDEDQDYDEEEDETTNVKFRFSLKDVAVILSLSSLLSVSLVTATFGVSGIQERLINNDVWDVMMAAFFFVCLFSTVSYLLVKMAAHYAVYLAIATLLAIVFPVNRNRQKRTLKEIFSKAKSQ
ncbi:unnamed protein product [Orchesella dallaii]|uniref:PGG domain-containing protein n=1 Tax=Orchesella dallaii TaxID=48710 RepID=A0ABP1QZ73_9HEXA